MGATPLDKARSLFGRVPARGCWLGIPGVVPAEIIGQAGFEFAIVDLEHGPSSLETALAQLVALKAGGTASILRVPESAPGGALWIKRALDIGAQAILAPSVESVEDAEACVRAFRYGPQGRRGNATRIVRAAGYGADADYLRRWNDEGLLLCQIESPGALERAGEIAAVEGVDGLFFGPADYGAAAGFPEDAALEAAFARMRSAAREAGKLSASVPFASLTAAALVADGVEVVAAASDVSILRKGAAAVLADAASGF